MPYNPTVNKPQDDVFQVDGFIQEGTDPRIREFVYPGIGRVIDAPSSYSLKANDILSMRVCSIHPVWMMSGLNYDDAYVKLHASFRRYNADLGSLASVFIPNNKKDTQEDSRVGGLVPSTSEIHMNNNVPIHYYGEHFATKKPGGSEYATFLTKFIDEDEIEVTQLSAVEYEIEVKNDLADDQWFYIPISSTKGLPNTMWGKIGNDSTLPEGATAGLIQMRSEAVLMAKYGYYLVTGDQLACLNQSTITIYRNNGTVGGTVPPAWFQRLETDVIESLPQYQTIKGMVENETEWYVCGYQTGCTTMGTGLFVQNENKVCALSAGLAESGVKYSRTFAQVRGAPKTSCTFGEMLHCEDRYFEDVAKSGLLAMPLPDNAIIPFSASDLELDMPTESWKPNDYRFPTHPDYSYAYAYFGTPKYVHISPTYTSVSDTQFCYTPTLFHLRSTMLSMMHIKRLDEVIKLTLKADPSWIALTSNSNVTPRGELYVPHRIKKDHTMEYTNHTHPTRGYDVDQMGFHTGKSGSVHSYPNGGNYWRGSAIINWVNPVINPAVGYNSAKDIYTHNAMTGGSVMAFVGYFPKGTKAGKYLWKPFKNTQISSGYLSVKYSEFIPSTIISKIKPSSITVPYLGMNIITAEVPTIVWGYQQVTDDDKDYKYWNVLRYAYIDNIENTRFTNNVLMTISQDTVPLVGYPIADKPMLMDLDDWTGDYACDVGDLAMTTPFYDPDIQDWVVVAASAQMQKFYRIRVEVNDVDGVTSSDPKEYVGRYVTRFKEVIDSKELFDTPYGKLVDVYGLCHTKDIHYLDGEEDDHLVLYGRTEYDDSARVEGSNLVVGTCRTYMEWDLHKDTMSRVRISDVMPVDFNIDADINWPKGIAVMYPYIYILGFHYEVAPKQPIIDPLVADGIEITGEGWQMALWKVDITSGIINDVIALRDVATFRYTYGIPALNKEANRLYRSDYNTLGAVRKYSFGPDSNGKLPASEVLPKISKSYEFPSLAGICHVSGQLMAFSNYHEKLVLINPLTGAVETLGTNIFPFSYPFNSNVASNGDLVSAVSLFGGRHFYTVHPFFHVCIGDGLPPNSYGAGIDVTDASNGTKLLRRCRLRNNLLRDRLSNVELIVPDPADLPGSEMLYLSWTGQDADKVKVLELNNHPSGDITIDPAGYVTFYLHVEPNQPIEKTFFLYLNAKFGRTTEFFGYRLRLGEEE